MLLETRFPKLLYGEAVVAAAAAVVSPPPQPYQISHLADQLFRTDVQKIAKTFLLRSSRFSQFSQKVRVFRIILTHIKILEVILYSRS